MYLTAERPGWRVECRYCGALGRTLSTIEKADEAWNTRSREAELEAGLRAAREAINSDVLHICPFASHPTPGCLKCLALKTINNVLGE